MVTNTPSYLTKVGEGYTLGKAYTQGNITTTATGKLLVADNDGFALDAQGKPDYKFSVIGNNNGATVSIAADGTWTYKPAAGFDGQDNILVRVVDAKGFSSTHSLHITVTGIAPSEPVKCTNYAEGTLGSTLTGILGVTDINGIDSPNFTHVTALGKYSGTFEIDPKTGEFSYSGASTEQTSGILQENVIVRVTDNLGMTSTINIDLTSYIPHY